MFPLPRLYPIVDTGLLVRVGMDPLTTASAMLDAGARILQYRHKGPFTRARVDEAAAIAALCRKASGAFILNDRADIALLLNAPAIHVGQDDLTPAQVKSIHTQAIVGFSTHNEAQFLAACEDPAVGYLAVGPVFGTASKENPDPVVGVAELKRLAARKRQPLVAIGGISLDLAPAVFEAGADSIAVISALIPPEPTAKAIAQRVREWLRVTDML